MSLLNTLFVPAFITQLSLLDYSEWTRIVLQLSILLASAVLTFYMFQYKERTSLDTALLLRELALTILFARFVYNNLTGHQSDHVIIFTYAFVAVSCLLVVVNVVKARAFTSSNTEKETLTDRS